MKEVIIHKKSISVSEDELGLYLPDNLWNEMYAELWLDTTVSNLNRQPLEDVIKNARMLHDIASKQVQPDFSPRQPLAPILVMTPGPRPVQEVIDYIQNTLRFSEAIIKAFDQ